MNQIEFMDNDGNTYNVGLKDCPFCGERPSICSIGNAHTLHRKVQIYCNNCRNKGFVVGAIIQEFAFCVEHAAQNWNRRAKG